MLELASPHADIGPCRYIYVLEEEQFDHIELIDNFHASNAEDGKENRGGGGVFIDIEKAETPLPRRPA